MVVNEQTGEIIEGDERIGEMFYRRSPSLEALFAALAKAQGEFGAAEKRGKVAFGNQQRSYATLDAVVEATKAALKANGLCFSQMPINWRNAFGVCSLLGHSSGQWIESTLAMAVKDPTNPQSVGSAITYMRRYAMMAVLGIPPEDDDGQAAVAVDPQQQSGKPPPRQPRGSSQQASANGSAGPEQARQSTQQNTQQQPPDDKAQKTADIANYHRRIWQRVLAFFKANETDAKTWLDAEFRLQKVLKREQITMAVLQKIESDFEEFIKPSEAQQTAPEEEVFQDDSNDWVEDETVQSFEEAQAQQKGQSGKGKRQ